MSGHSGSNFALHMEDRASKNEAKKLFPESTKISWVPTSLLTVCGAWHTVGAQQPGILC